MTALSEGSEEHTLVPLSEPPPDLSSLASFKDTVLPGSVSAFLDQANCDGIIILEDNFNLAGNLYPTCTDCLKSAIETISLWNLSLTQDTNNVDLPPNILELYGRTL